MNEIWGILFSPINMAGMAILAGCNPPTHPKSPHLDPPPPTPIRPTWTPPPQPTLLEPPPHLPLLDPPPPPRGLQPTVSWGGSWRPEPRGRPPPPRHFPFAYGASMPCPPLGNCVSFPISVVVVTLTPQSQERLCVEHASAGTRQTAFAEEQLSHSHLQRNNCPTLTYNK